MASIEYSMKSAMVDQNRLQPATALRSGCRRRSPTPENRERARTEALDKPVVDPKTPGP